MTMVAARWATLLCLWVPLADAFVAHHRPVERTALRVSVLETDLGIADRSTASTTLLIDVESAISTSSYPWTVESLAASASFLLNDSNDSILLMAPTRKSNSTLYTQGPLVKGVSIVFHNNNNGLCLAQSGIKHVTTNPLVADRIHPQLLFRDLEALGPKDSLPFDTAAQHSVQSILDLQHEIAQLRGILKQRNVKRKGKNISRKKRTKLKKRTIRLETRVLKRSDYNVTLDSMILEQRLDDSSTTSRLVLDKIDWMDQVKELLVDVVVKPDKQHQDSTVSHAPIPGYDLSSQVVQVERTSTIPTTLRILVLSDTHGYEREFQKFLSNDAYSKMPVKFPDADVLIHCGDFWGSSRSRDFLDNVMAAQTHIAEKYVIRGNHDPRQHSFPRSKAEYVTSKQTVTLNDGTIVELRPFLRAHSHSPLSSHNAVDILVTHEPPFGLLDQTYRKERVGSLSLRHAVESSSQQPALWLCGHIHEGRGALWHSFSSPKQATAVLNAANANSGKARRIARGPVLVDLVPRKVVE